MGGKGKGKHRQKGKAKGKGRQRWVEHPNVVRWVEDPNEREMRLHHPPLDMRRVVTIWLVYESDLSLEK